MAETGISSLVDTSLDELEVARLLAAVARSCVSHAGADHVRALRPSMDARLIQRDLDCVGECTDLLQLGESIPFDRLGDVSGLLSRTRIAGNFLSAPDLLIVLEALQTSRVIKSFFLNQALKAPTLNEECSVLVDDRLLEKHITDAIDDTGLIRDNASRELLSIRRDIHELSARLRLRLQRILKKFGEDELLQEEFVTQRDGRFVLPLRVENKRSVEGIIHGVSQSGQTVFLEPAETYELNNELAILHGREQREMIRILTTLTAEVGSVSHAIEAAVDVLTFIDSIIARARFAMNYGGIKPVLTEDVDIELHNVRHPLLVLASKNPVQDVVPLSIRFDGTSKGILISGPNAGGKTVAMKTIGLSITMAMMGMFPLGMSSLHPRRIMTAIGDHQSIESNLSTFSSQIIRLRDILSHCDAEALVLIDEICAGTDPAEGGALAAGILDSLIERGACFVVTTHQSSLKQYALTRPSITNASLEFDGEHLKPTFTFLFGVPGNSYAFALARTVGMPEIVLERSKGYLGDRHNELEQSIQAIQAFRLEAQQLQLKAASELAKAESARKDAENRLAEAKKKRSTVVEDAREEAREILRKANSLVETTIREVREQQKSIATIKNTFELEKSALTTSEIEAAAQSEVPDTSALGVGDHVQIAGTTSTGSIISIDGAQVRVDVNGIT
ncbi:MAG: endonuclease MutS2, partial [Ignavibacteria bacterium]